jgi:hypothetical protein
MTGQNASKKKMTNFTGELLSNRLIAFNNALKIKKSQN